MGLFYIPCRFLLALWGFIGFFVVYMLRVNLSVALVAMVNTTAINLNKTRVKPECEIDYTNQSKVHDKDGEFLWDEYEQGIILGAFFWGYMITQVPGALIAHHYSAKWVMSFGVVSTSLFTILTPLAAKLSMYLFVVLRVIEGLCEAVTYPAMNGLLGKWSPSGERTKLAAFAYSGGIMGTIVGQPLAGILCNSSILGGWPSAFYILGITGFVWFIGWTWCAFDSPEQHPRISNEEKCYIISSIEVKTEHYKHIAVPWSKIVCCPPFLALLVAHVCVNWSFYTLLTCLPTYMSRILGFDISENGILSALPYIATFISMLLSGVVADYLRSRNILSTVVVRKIFCSFASFGAAGGYIAVSYVGCNHVLSIIFFCVALGMLGFNQAAVGSNHLDLAPQYAGTLFAVTNSVATLPGILSPMIVGIITQNGETRAHWQLIFYFVAGISCFGCLVYLIFGSGEVQKWAKEMEIDNECTDNKVNERLITTETVAHENPTLIDVTYSDVTVKTV